MSACDTTAENYRRLWEEECRLRQEECRLRQEQQDRANKAEAELIEAEEQAQKRVAEVEERAETRVAQAQTQALADVRHEHILRQAAEKLRLQMRQREHGQKRIPSQEAQKVRVEERKSDQYHVGINLLRFVTFWTYPPRALEPVPIPANTLGVGTPVDGKPYVRELLPIPEDEIAQMKEEFGRRLQSYRDKTTFTSEALLQQLAAENQVWPVRTKEETIDYRRATLMVPATELLRGELANEDARKLYNCRSIGFQKGMSQCPVENKRMKSQKAGVPGGYVIATGLDGTMRVAMPYKCKRPQKFPIDIAESILKNKNLFSDVVDQLSSRYEDDDPQGRTKLAVTMSLVQEISYMVASGCQYGYVDAGTCLVFINIKPVDFTKAYYYLCPNSSGGSSATVAQARFELPSSDLIDSPLMVLSGFIRRSLTVPRLNDEEYDEWTRKATAEMPRWPGQQSSAQASTSSQRSSSNGSDESFSNYRTPESRSSSSGSSSGSGPGGSQSGPTGSGPGNGSEPGNGAEPGNGSRTASSDRCIRKSTRLGAKFRRGSSSTRKLEQSFAKLTVYSGFPSKRLGSS